MQIYTSNKHTHMYIYTYICVCMCVLEVYICIYIRFFLPDICVYIHIDILDVHMSGRKNISGVSAEFPFTWQPYKKHILYKYPSNGREQLRQEEREGERF
jgi:hypothetical protein